LVGQCLAKVPDDRPDTARDVRNHLRWMREASGLTQPAVGRSGRRVSVRPVVLLRALLLGAIIGATAMWLLRPASPAPLAVRSSLDVRPAENLSAGATGAVIWLTPGGSTTAFTWTPDGRALVFVAQRAGVQQLYIRPLDGAEARPLKGTEGAFAPALSADGPRERPRGCQVR